MSYLIFNSNMKRKYNNLGEDYSYAKFLHLVSAMILKNTTCKGFKSPYENKKFFVVSRKNMDQVPYDSDLVQIHCGR